MLQRCLSHAFQPDTCTAHAPPAIVPHTDELLLEERRQTGAQAGPSASLPQPPGSDDDDQQEGASDLDTLSEEQWEALLDSMPVEPDPELFQDGPGKIPLVVTGDDPDAMEQAAEAGVAPCASIYLPPDDLSEEQAAALLKAVAAEDQGEGEGEEEVDPATEAGGKYPRPPERGVELSQLLVAVEEPALAMEHRGERVGAAQQQPWQCAMKQGAVCRLSCRMPAADCTQQEVLCSGV